MIKLVENFNEKGYWYFTTHGDLFTFPRDVYRVCDTIDGQNRRGTWGYFICLNRRLTEQEMYDYDLYKLVPNGELDKIPNDEFVKDYIYENGFNGSIETLYENELGINIEVIVDSVEDYQYLKNILGNLRYREGKKQVKSIDNGGYFVTCLFG